MLEVSDKEVVGRLAFDNPWWGEQGAIDQRYQDYPRRYYFELFLELLTDESVKRAVVLMGPRRVGKTVMVFHSIQALIDAGVPSTNILYLSLETPLYTGIRLEKLLMLFQEKFSHSKDQKLFVFFDEIQYLRDWEVHLKSLVDSFHAYQFVATGSAAAALRLKSVESGAGRFTDFLLPPLTFAEYLSFVEREAELILSKEEDTEPGTTLYQSKNIEALNDEFVNYLNYGGYPEAVFSESIRQDTSRYIKSDIIDKVLLRDLPSLYGIGDIQELNRLFTTLAYNTGSELTLEELSQSARVAKNTIKRYLEYLEAAFLLRRVNRIDQNARRFRRTTTFKVYLTNCSMRSALFGYVQADSDAMGALTETAIYSQWLHSTAINHLYYARWAGGGVDIVNMVKATQKPNWIAEVKWSDRPVTDMRLLDNCVTFHEQNNLGNMSVLVTTKTQRAQKVYRGIPFEFAPASEYAFTVGRNILRTKTDDLLLAGLK